MTSSTSRAAAAIATAFARLPLAASLAALAVLSACEGTFFLNLAANDRFTLHRFWADWFEYWRDWLFPAALTTGFIFALNVTIWGVARGVFNRLRL